MALTAPTIFAIDFGTSNSLVAGANENMVFSPVPLDPKEDDPTILRSVLFAPEKDSWFFGQEAIRSYIEHASQGRLLRSLKKYLPDPGFTGTHIFGKNQTLVDLLSIFLRTLRARSNAHYGVEVDRVLLGRPAAFSLNSEQDQLAEKRLEAAARMAGFKHVSFCPEPLAAAYEYQKSLVGEKLVLIADFGGGTSDFCLLRMSRGGGQRQKVLAMNGLSLAGDAYDGALMKHKLNRHFGSEVQYQMPMSSHALQMPTHILNKLNSPADINFLARKEVVSFLNTVKLYALSAEEERQIQQLQILAEEGLGYALYKHIEECKKQLSSRTQSFFEFHNEAGIHIEETFTADEFEGFSSPISEKIIHTMREVMASGQVTPANIDLVCLTGGTAQIKSLKKEFEKIFGANKIESFHFFHSIIQGLAEKAREIA